MAPLGGFRFLYYKFDENTKRPLPRSALVLLLRHVSKGLFKDHALFGGVSTKAGDSGSSLGDRIYFKDEGKHKKAPRREWETSGALLVVVLSCSFRNGNLSRTLRVWHPHAPRFGSALEDFAQSAIVLDIRRASKGRRDECNRL